MVQEPTLIVRHLSVAFGGSPLHRPCQESQGRVADRYFRMASTANPTSPASALSPVDVSKKVEGSG